jgi:hypothetical protein
LTKQAHQPLLLIKHQLRLLPLKMNQLKRIALLHRKTRLPRHRLRVVHHH